MVLHAMLWYTLLPLLGKRFVAPYIMSRYVCTLTVVYSGIPHGLHDVHAGSHVHTVSLRTC